MLGGARATPPGKENAVEIPPKEVSRDYSTSGSSPVQEPAPPGSPVIVITVKPPSGKYTRSRRLFHGINTSSASRPPLVFIA